MWSLAGIYAVFGLIIGSFLNVLILRHGVRSVGGRSVCPRCGSTIVWHDNIPLLSWVFLGGRCRSCRGAISTQYPLVEVATALLFAGLGNAIAPSLGALAQPSTLLLLLDYFAIVAFLVAIFVYDLYYTIIPNMWVYPTAALAFLSQFLTIPLEGWPIVSALFAGPAASLPLFALWAVSRGRWMGFGDVKLALGIGWILGPVYGLLAILLAFVIGAVVSLCILLPLPYFVRFLGVVGITRLTHMAQGYTMKSEVPFGPFLITSCIILWFILAYDYDLPLTLLTVSL